MYNCYNEALNWYRNQKKVNVKNKNGDTIAVDSHDAKVVNSLLNQYHFGISAKKELYYMMIRLGVLNGA